MRTLTRIIPSVPTSDGAGVQLRRSLGGRQGASLDPFLMLDEFYSDDASDFIAGFPSHPHRGFETVTYMLDGHMRHEDHLGNRGDLQAGDVQWMTAARGIIHSESAAQLLPARAAGVLSDGDRVRIQAGASEARALLLAARPLHEPVVQHGPFVMNTREEIEQAIDDFRSGRLAAVAS